MNAKIRRWCAAAAAAAALLGGGRAEAAYSLVLTNGYGDAYRMNLMRDRGGYQAYRGVCSYKGFSLSGCSTTGEVVMLRVMATASVPEHSSIVSTTLRWGTTMYFLNDVFRWMNSTAMAGYENWYPFDMSCSVAMYVAGGGFGAAGIARRAAKELGWDGGAPDEMGAMREILAEPPAPKAKTGGYSLVMTNGYGDRYQMNLMRDRGSYQAYRGICSYRGFSLSGCSTTGEVVMLRVMASGAMPEHYSLLSTSLRWGTTTYVLNDVFRWMNSTTMAGYENWYPFDMSCSVAMYVESGGFGAAGTERGAAKAWPAAPASRRAGGRRASDPIRIGALVPLTGDLADIGSSYTSAYGKAMAEMAATPGMPAFELLVENTGADPLLAAQKLEGLYAAGVQVVVGPETSAECEGLRTLATNGAGMLLLSSSCTASSLAIPGDNLMRLTTDDTNQARELARQVAADGIDRLAMLKRSDTYGDGFGEAFRAEYERLGGRVFFDEYYPRATELFGAVATNFAAAVGAEMARTGEDGTGVLLVAFDEGVHLLEAARGFGSLEAARWYGTEGMAGNAALQTAGAAREMALLTRFSCSQPAAHTNAKYGEVAAWVEAQTGRAPRTYPMVAYDALWLAGLALRDTGGTGTVAEVRQAIRDGAAEREGATGPIEFNDADDRTGWSYEFIKVSEANGWDGTWTAAPNAPLALGPANLASNGFCARWRSAAGATNYLVDVATNAAFGEGDYVEGYRERPAGNVMRLEVGGLVPGAVHWYRVRAQNAAGAGAASAAAEADLGLAVDGDGDGMPDWEEAVAGTDPGDAESTFRVAGTAAGTVALQTAAGRRYHLQHATNLLWPAWMPVAGATGVVGTGGPLVLTNGAPESPRGFYRIGVEAP